MPKNTARKSFPWSPILGIVNSLVFCFIFAMLSPQQFLSAGSMWLMGVVGILELINLFRFCYAYFQKPASKWVFLENVVPILCILSSIVCSILSSSQAHILENLNTLIPGILYVVGLTIRTAIPLFRLIYQYCFARAAPAKSQKSKLNRAIVMQVLTSIIMCTFTVAVAAIMIGQASEYSWLGFAASIGFLFINSFQFYTDCKKPVKQGTPLEQAPLSPGRSGRGGIVPSSSSEDLKISPRSSIDLPSLATSSVSSEQPSSMPSPQSLSTEACKKPVEQSIAIEQASSSTGSQSSSPIDSDLKMPSLLLASVEPPLPAASNVSSAQSSSTQSLYSLPAQPPSSSSSLTSVPSTLGFFPTVIARTSSRGADHTLQVELTNRTLPSSGSSVAALV